MPILEIIALLSCSLFAGAAIYINVAEHPARLECGVELASTVFGPSYRRAAAMQAALALIAAITGVAVAINLDSFVWFLGAALIFAVVPFTFIVIMPTNKLLLDPPTDQSSEQKEALLRKWGRLHGVRSGLSSFAALLFAYAAVIS